MRTRKKPAKPCQVGDNVDLFDRFAGETVTGEVVEVRYDLWIDDYRVFAKIAGTTVVQTHFHGVDVRSVPAGMLF